MYLVLSKLTQRGHWRGRARSRGGKLTLLYYYYYFGGGGCQSRYRGLTSFYWQPGKQGEGNLRNSSTVHLWTQLILYMSLLLVWWIYKVLLHKMIFLFYEKGNPWPKYTVFFKTFSQGNECRSNPLFKRKTKGNFRLFPELFPIMMIFQSSTVVDSSLKNKQI